MERGVPLPNLLTLLIAGGVFLFLVVIQLIARTRKPVQRAVGGVFVGVGTLAAVNIAGFFTGVSIPISLLSVGVSAAAGIPGVTLMLLLNLLLS